MSNLQVEVERALSDEPRTRSDDAALIVEVLNARGANLTPHQKFLIEGISFESVTRIRRKLQQEGLYPANERVRKARSIKAAIAQQTFPKVKAHEAEQPLSYVVLPWGQG